MYSYATQSGFPFNEKSFQRSMMRPVPKIENELDRMMEKTRNIPTQEIEGEWKFNGYFPRECKAMPLCHMNELEFHWDKNGSKGESYKFNTYGNKTGTSCSIK
jgi:hypothetical protein